MTYSSPPVLYEWHHIRMSTQKPVNKVNTAQTKYKTRYELFCDVKSKGKAVPLQAWSGPEGSRKLRFLDYVTTAQDGGRLSALGTGCLYSQEILLVLTSVTGWIDPRATVRSEGLGQWKIQMTPAGIEPATFRFVAQHLNHCATVVPLRWCYAVYNSSPLPTFRHNRSVPSSKVKKFFRTHRLSLNVGKELPLCAV